MELKKEIESLLFSSGKIMSEEELSELTNNSKNNVKEALQELKKEYDERDTSLMLVQSGHTWKLNVREKYVNLVTKIVADTELPFPVLETLAVIAYKAPVLQSEVIKIRGSNAYEHVGLLVKEEFVDKKKEGRSFKISLTSKFFKYFDVEGEKDIKKALKDVKASEKAPKKIGDLKVVDLPPGEVKKQEEEELKEKIGDLEVVDARRSEASSATESTNVSFVGSENPDSLKTEFPLESEQAEEEKEEKLSVENNKPDHDFLKNIETRIGELSQKNDELDKDELFKRQDEVNKEMEEEKQEPVKEEEKKEEEVKEEAAVEKEAEETTAEPEEKKEEPEKEEKSQS